MLALGAIPPGRGSREPLPLGSEWPPEGKREPGHGYPHGATRRGIFERREVR